MWRDKGRSGIGDQVFEPDNGNPVGTWEDQSGLSPNGRQWHNEVTGEQRDLSGANYWHQRKEMCPRFAHIQIGDYKTPSYYHQPRVKVSVSEIPNEVKTPILEKVDNPLNLSSDNYFLRLYNWWKSL